MEEEEGRERGRKRDSEESRKKITHFPLSAGWESLQGFSQEGFVAPSAFFCFLFFLGSGKDRHTACSDARRWVLFDSYLLVGGLDDVALRALGLEDLGACATEGGGFVDTSFRRMELNKISQRLHSPLTNTFSHFFFKKDQAQK